MAFFTLCRLKRPPSPRNRHSDDWKSDFESLGETLPLLQISDRWKKTKQKTPHENQTRSRSPIETNKSSAQMDVSIWKEWERGGDYDPPARWETEVNTQWLETQRDVEYKSGFCIFFFPLLHLVPIFFLRGVFFLMFSLCFFSSCPSLLPSFPPCWWCESILFEQFHNIIVSWMPPLHADLDCCFSTSGGGTQKWVAELFWSWLFFLFERDFKI